MKKEIAILVVGTISNLILAIIKVVGGGYFGLSSLLADGLHTFSDSIVNVISIVGTKLSRKKATKHHPYGFGRVEYLTNLFVGIMLGMLSIFIFINSFNAHSIIPSLNVLWLLGIVIFVKGFTLFSIYLVAKKSKSKILFTTVKEGLADIYSTLGVISIIIGLQFSNEVPILSYIDIIGSVIISIIIFSMAYKIVKQNSLALIGEIEEDAAVIEKVKRFLCGHYSQIKDEDFYLIKYGSYYKLQLNIEVDNNMSLKSITRLEKKIQKDLLRNKSLAIKYITIFVTSEL